MTPERLCEVRSEAIYLSLFHANLIESPARWGVSFFILRISAVHHELVDEIERLEREVDSAIKDLRNKTAKLFPEDA